VTIPLSGSIDGTSGFEFLQKLDAAKEAGAKHLTIRINSPGGQVGVGLALIQRVRETGIPTTCVVEDYAISMAAIFLESSACGERVVHAHSLVMFHGVRSGAEGPQRIQENNAAAMAAINRMGAILVCSRTGWNVDDYVQAIVVEGRELWLVGDLVVSMGAADKVIPSPAPNA
jgi:ATP-dependent Clp protease protease subunit